MILKTNLFLTYAWRETFREEFGVWLTPREQTINSKVGRTVAMAIYMNVSKLLEMKINEI